MLGLLGVDRVPVGGIQSQGSLLRCMSNKLIYTAPRHVRNNAVYHHRRPTQKLAGRESHSQQCTLVLRWVTRAIPSPRAATAAAAAAIPSTVTTTPPPCGAMA